MILDRYRKVKCSSQHQSFSSNQLQNSQGQQSQEVAELHTPAFESRNKDTVRRWSSRRKRSVPHQWSRPGDLEGLRAVVGCGKDVQGVQHKLQRPNCTDPCKPGQTHIPEADLPQAAQGLLLHRGFGCFLLLPSAARWQVPAGGEGHVLLLTPALWTSWLKRKV